MNFLSGALNDQWLELVPVLLHTVWQGSLIALLLAAALAFLPASKARIRYALSVTALLAILTGGFLTHAVMDHQKSAAPSETAALTLGAKPGFAAIDEEPASAPASLPVVESGPSDSRQAPPGTAVDYRTFILAGWLLGVFAMLGRLAFAMHTADTARARCRPCDNTEVTALLDQLIARAGCAEHRVRLLIADHLMGPLTMGVLAPVIILPASLVTGTPHETVRAILAHELAHIRRQDYLVNLVQLLIETLLFFNPAVWLVSHWIRVEREACCDAMASRMLDDEINYVSTLANYAQSCRSVPLPAMAFGDQRTPSGLIDRVRRLLVPGYQPRLRLPLTSLSVFLLGGILLLAALHQGSRAAVEVGARLLSPEERIERIREIQDSHPVRPNVFDYAGVDSDSPEVKLAGTVLDEDGKPMPERLFHVTSRTERLRLSATESLHTNPGSFTGDVQAGEIFLSVTAKGYAPALLGPFDGQPGKAITNLNVAMTRGFETRLRLTDQYDRPIQAVTITGSYEFGVNVALGAAVTGADGIAIFTHSLQKSVKLKVRHPGFQLDEQSFELSTNSIPTWKLYPAKPALIRVVDRKGNPVPNVEARLIQQKGFANMGYDTETKAVFARGNREGVLALDSLRDDSVYWFLVEAPGFRRDFLHKVYAAETNRVFTLGPPIIVSGHFEGDLGLLKTRERSVEGRRIALPYMSYSSAYTIEDGSRSKGSTDAVQIRDGKAFFAITNLLPGRLVIHAGTERVERTVNDSIRNLVIPLAAPASQNGEAETLPTRRVRLDFKPPTGHPAAQGDLHVRLSHQEAGNQMRYEKRVIVVTNNVAELDLTIGSRITAEPGRFTGYWFKSVGHQEIVAGDGPQRFAINCIPAGALFGTITEPDGSPARGIMISVVTETKSPRQEGSLDIDVKNSSSPSDRTREFNATPLPFGGTYRIVAHRGPAFALSDSVTIDAKHPFHETHLIIPAGRTITGRIVDESGEPIAGARYDYSFSASPGHGFSGSDQFTDRLGRFTFENLGPAVAGRWYIQVRDNPGYQRLELPLRFDREMEIRLPTGKQLQGRVVDQKTGWPIPGVDVYALPNPFDALRNHYVNADAVTDQQGHFKFTTMDEGKYHLRTRSGSLPPGLEVEVRGGQSETVTLPMTPSEWSKLKPVPPTNAR
jgi:beta-lactamase regulating signal transducer with metallopeptidase domain/protocatechuate 3,4-dioxygenase beta subunit